MSKEQRTIAKSKLSPAYQLKTLAGEGMMDGSLFGTVNSSYSRKSEMNFAHFSHS
jgi:hypothetical protein